jgi:UDP-N-acetylmuramoylalanine--D-glutamate ligase
VIMKGLKKRGLSNATEIQTNMDDIVDFAKNTAHTGDVVLLSTACASFGMFKNYQDRGDQFKNSIIKRKI